MARKKKTEQEPDSLVNHPLVRHAIEVFNATPMESDSDEAVESPFAQAESNGEQPQGEKTAGTGQEPAPDTSAREQLLRQYGTLADGDATISANRDRRR